jgi:hypothetical protein
VAPGCIIQVAGRGLETHGVKCAKDELGVDRRYIIRLVYCFYYVWKYHVFIRLAVMKCGRLKMLMVWS